MQSIRTLSLAIAATLAFAPAAFAQDASGETASGKRVAIVGGYSLLEPTKNPSLDDGTRLNVDGDGAATGSVSYFVNDNIAIEAWGAVDKFGHRVNVGEGKVASVDQQPYAVSGQYHIGAADNTVRPFVGLGYYESNYDGEKAEPTGPLAGQRIGLTTQKGPMATVGVDFNISPTWFARADARYLHGNESDVEVNGLKAGETELNPVVVGVGLGARF